MYVMVLKRPIQHSKLILRKLRKVDRVANNFVVDWSVIGVFSKFMELNFH